MYFGGLWLVAMSKYAFFGTMVVGNSRCILRRMSPWSVEYDEWWVSWYVMRGIYMNIFAIYEIPIALLQYSTSTSIINSTNFAKSRGWLASSPIFIICSISSTTSRLKRSKFAVASKTLPSYNQVLIVRSFTWLSLWQLFLDLPFQESEYAIHC